VRGEEVRATDLTASGHTPAHFIRRLVEGGINAVVVQGLPIDIPFRHAGVGMTVKKRGQLGVDALDFCGAVSRKLEKETPASLILFLAMNS